MRFRWILRALALAVLVGAGLTTSLAGYTQGRPDLVWMAGGEAEYVASVAYSHDAVGKMIATSTSRIGNGYAASLKIWRASDGALLRTFFNGSVYAQGAYGLNSVAFSPDDKLVAAGTESGTILVWNVADGKLVYTLAGFTGSVNSIAFSPDGALLAGGSNDTTVRIYNVADGSPAITLTDHPTAVLSVAFSPDGKSFASSCTQKDSPDITLSLIVRRASDWSRLFTSSTAGSTLAFSPDGQTLAVNTSIIYLFRVSDGAYLGGLAEGGRGAVFSPDGKTIAAGAINSIGAVYLWNWSTKTLTSTLTGHTGAVNSVAYSADGLSLVSGSDDHTTRTWHTSDGSPGRILTQQTGFITSLAVSPDGQMVASGSADFEFFVRRVTDGAILFKGQAGHPFVMAFSADSQSLAVSDDVNGYHIKIWKVKDWSLQTTLSANTGSLTYSPNGQYFAAGADGTVKLWRLPDYTECTLQGDLPATAVYSVAFSPDGKTFASGGDDHTVRLWDASTCKLVRTLPLFDSTVYSTAFSPDGQTLAVGVAGGGISLWNVARGNPLQAWHSDSPGNAVISVTFSPDGQVLLTGKENSTLSYWQVSDGTLLRKDTEETAYWGLGGSTPIVYTPDGTRVLYGRIDGTVCAALNPFRNTVLPGHGGNTGSVTTKVVISSDFPLAPGAIVTLRGPGQLDIVGTPLKLENSFVLDVQFDLRGAPLGKRDVIITNADGSTRTYPLGFTVELGRKAELAVELLGRKQFRAGVIQNFDLVCYNLGNTDGSNLSAWLTGIPKNVNWTILTELSPPPSNPTGGPINWNEVPYLFDAGGITNGFGFHTSVGAGGQQHIGMTLSSDIHQQFIACPFPGPQEPCDAFTLAVLDFLESLANSFGLDNIADIIDNIIRYCELLNGESLGELVLPDKFTFFNAIDGTLTRLIEEEKERLADDLTRDEAQRAQDLQSAFNTQCLSLGSNISIDPNEISGRIGAGVQQWLSDTQPLNYVVSFENVPNASAPAQNVVVTDHLDSTLVDTTTVSLGTITIRDKTATPTAEYSLPVGKREFNADVDLRPDKNLIVHVHASLDMLSGDLTWTFTSIDPATGLGLDPSDPDGFLDPGQEGSVLFSVMPKPGLPTGTVVTNKATIVFDVNAPMDTNVWFNTLDNDTPVSDVNPLDIVQMSNQFTVNWSGNDVGSGVRDYTIYVSDNYGPLTPWLSNTADTQAIFTGVPGHTYAFYSVARDNTYNVETAHALPDTTTLVMGGGVADVSNQVTIALGGYRLNRSTGRFVQTITLTNTGTALTGPVSLVLDSLSSGATLFNQTGTTGALTPAGSPYFDVVTGNMAAGASVTVTVEFTDPTKAAVSYSTRVLAGSGSR